MTKVTVFKILKTVLPLALGVYLIWFFFSSMSDEDKQHFYRAFRDANYSWIVFSLIFGLLALLARAQRWKYVLEPIGYKTKFWNRYHAIMIGYLVNYTIPRAGEPARSAMLYRSDGVPFMKSFGTIISERAIDVLVLGVIAFITIYLGYDSFVAIKAQLETITAVNETSAEGFQWKYVIYGALGMIVVILGALFVFKSSFRKKLIGFIKDIIAGVLSIFKSKQPLAYIFYTLVIWLSYIAMFLLPFYALEQTSEVPMSCIFLGFIAGSLGVAFTNGGIGAYPLLVGFVIAFYLKEDYPSSDAEGIGKALGMLIWTSQTLMMIVLGLISLVLLPKNYSKNDKPTSVHSG
jgi:hypothetical protein